MTDNKKISLKQSKTQHRTVAGVSVRIISDDGAGDWDELLREAIRVALRIGTNPAEDDFDELYGRIHELIDAYIRSRRALATTMTSRTASGRIHPC